MSDIIKLSPEDHQTAIAEHAAIVQEMQELSAMLHQVGLSGLPEGYGRRMSLLADRYSALTKMIHDHSIKG